MSTFLGMPGGPVRGPAADTAVGQLTGDRPFPAAAREALADTRLRRNLAHATATIRAKRASVVGEVPDWEELRDAGSAIKADVMARLPELLEQLEATVTARGGAVHWARDAAEANAIVTALVQATGADEVVKVKSMATQEIGLNEASRPPASPRTRPTSPSSSSSSATTSRPTSSSRRSTAAAPRSATFSFGRCPASSLA